MNTRKNRKLIRALPLGFAVITLAACSSIFGGSTVQVRSVETKSSQNSRGDSLYSSAVTAINGRDYGRALEYLQEAKSLDSTNVKILNALGVVYDKLGRFDLSTRYYTQARQIDPGSTIISRNIAYSNVLQGLVEGDRLASRTPAEIQPVAALQPVAPLRKDVAVAITTDVATVQAPSKVMAPSFAMTDLIAANPVQLVPVPAASTGPSPANATINQIAIGSEGAVFSALPRLLPTVHRMPHLAAVPPVPIPAEKRKVITIGHPFSILDGTGRADEAAIVSNRLMKMGWTIQMSKAGRVSKVSELFYPPQNASAALAMQRTLPFPVRATEDVRGSMRLVVGTDYLSWKPKNDRLAALWRKRSVVAALPLPPSKGVR
jgi:hypothetical protein